MLAIKKKAENKKFNIAWKRNGIILISPFGKPYFTKESHFTRTMTREQEIESDTM